MSAIAPIRLSHTLADRVIVSTTESPSNGNGIWCRCCGATPAANAVFRGHRGLFLAMQHRKAEGPFCRDCGLATYRSLTADSLWQGWWGPSSFVVNPGAMVVNLFHRAKVAALPPPDPGSPYQPMSPGKPLFRRWQFAGMLIPAAYLAAITLAIVNIAKPPPPSHTPNADIPAWALGPRDTSAPPTTDRWAGHAHAGECLRNKKTETWVAERRPDVEIVPCTDPRAQAEVLGRAMSGVCGLIYPDSDSSLNYYAPGPVSGMDISGTLCLRVVR
ncbi:hypothetical protein [Nocardia xishanensis]|uniref:Uncharacterized protein n=1 Tax=Nocardia xishanensis TaxID=238964 RepID=A0ABW7WRD8_9NOCA